MDETKNTVALILNRRAYWEDDSLVTVYSPKFGKLNLVARGAQKLQSKLAGHIEPLTLADIMIIRGKGYDYVGSAITRESYASIRSDLNKLYYAGQAFSLFDKFVKENQTDERLFFLTINCLEVLNNFFDNSDHVVSGASDLNKESGKLLFSFFALKFLSELGYQPEMFKCLICGERIKPGKNYFNLISGGIMCYSCFTKESVKIDSGELKVLTISDNCVKIIRYIISNDLYSWEKLKVDKRLIKELSLLVNNFVKFCV